MYEAVHAIPDGESTVARYARTADRQGFDGIVVRTRTADADLDAASAEYDVDVVSGVEIDAEDPSRAGGAVGDFRTDYAIVIVVGGDDAMNRYAVEQDRVDVLTRPMAGSGSFNHVLAKAAVEHDTAVEFDFGRVLRATGGRRVQAIRDLRKLREIVDHYDAPYVVSGNPWSHLELRASRELVAVGEAIGFDADAVRAGLEHWGEIAERNRHRLSEEFIAPGVQRGRYEEND